MVMSFNPNWRDNATQALVDDDLNSFLHMREECGDESVLAQILYSGFKGYQNYTDEELETELRERDISTVFGENDD
jgi:hypothetical protein